MDNKTMIRIAIAFERIATAIENSPSVEKETLPKATNSTVDVLRELLKHCERTSSGKARSATASYSNSDKEREGCRKASEKWKRYAEALKRIIENSNKGTEVT